MSSSTVTYTSVYSDSEPWRFQCVSDAEPQSPEAALQSPEHALPSPDYVPGPEHPPYPDYVPDPEYPKYVAPFDDGVPADDQPLPVDASPTALSPGYIADSNPEEDLEEDPEEDLEEDPADYPVDGGDDDDDDDDEEEEAFEEDEDEARKTVRLQPPMAASTEALIAEFASAPTPSSPPSSPLSPWSSPLPQIPSPPLPSHHDSVESCITIHPPSIRDTITTPVVTIHCSQRRYSRGEYATSKESPFFAHTSMYEIGESSSAAAARQTRRTLARSVDYGFINTVDASIRASESRAMAAVGEVNERVTDLAITQTQEAQELYVRCDNAQDDQALLRAQVSLLTRDIRYFRSMAYSYERKAAEARRTWT
ncbi:hypothetical protein Tco_1099438, partial [Tanacetum coccineum]